MSLIYIKEIFSNEHSVGIQVDGFLDSQSLPILKDFCEKYFQSDKQMFLYLGGLRHINWEGIDFLKDKDKENKVTYIEAPEFIHLKE
jgi:hypothetical protein